MSQDQTPGPATLADLAKVAAAAPDRAAIARFCNRNFSAGPMTDAWLQEHFAGALAVANLVFGETEAGRAAVLRGFANRILLGHSGTEGLVAAALAVPFTENPPAAEVAP